MTVIYLFSDDLRLQDHPGLAAAAKVGEQILPVYIDDHSQKEWPEGGASRWWRHHSLKSLAESIKSHGGNLVILQGPLGSTLEKLCSDQKVKSVFCDIGLFARMRKVPQGLSINGVSCNSVLNLDQCLNKEGRPYQVFTSFWKSVQEKLQLTLVKEFTGAFAKTKVAGALELDELKLVSNVQWHSEFSKHWQPGERGATARLLAFEEKLSNYQTARDLPAIDGTSSLSPHLHFGEIHPARIFEALKSKRSSSADRFRAELGWREFARSLLHHFPHTANEPLRNEFKRFPWEQNKKLFKAWTKGQTGYPIVDAGMRQLWATGWMHNRVRMIVASFLTKDLRIHWLEGARWFWDTLVDADLPSNTLGWQWAAGCGADAAPYFRVFNPTLQGQKFDPKGDYVRRWVPELAGVDARSIHTPWELGGLFKPKGYVDPIVDHAAERIKALKAFESLKSI
jgi:deoxyribodipyrimidine photo-lyase